jgi:hypothetical protein
VLASEEARAFRGATHPSLEEYWSVYQEVAERWDSPVDRAIVGGTVADRLGFAFAAGYRAALAQLLPDLPRRTRACLSVTEAGGAHPRAIQTRLDPDGDHWVLSGEKLWTTLADRGEVFLVAASTGQESGRNQIRMVLVPAGAVGLRLEPMPATPFAPEISHCRVVLERVRVSPEAVLPGDGYERCIKPFRTVEDIHVLAAATAYVLGEGTRFDWPREIRARLIHLLAALRELAGTDPLAPDTHLALAGAFASWDQLMDDADAHWDAVEQNTRARWVRDRTLLTVAGGARRRRFESAWKRLETAAVR